MKKFLMKSKDIRKISIPSDISIASDKSALVYLLVSVKTPPPFKSEDVLII